jgi:hypothetical protein
MTLDNRTRYVWSGYGQRHEYVSLSAARRSRDKWSQRTRCGTSIHQLTYVPGYGWQDKELTV